jgi:hypothetical protein
MPGWPPYCSQTRDDHPIFVLDIMSKFFYKNACRARAKIPTLAPSDTSEVKSTQTGRWVVDKSAPSLRNLLIGVLAFSLIVPLPAWSFSRPLGTARAGKVAKLSLDGGKTWLAFNGAALPVLPGAELRTTGGTASVELTSGSRVDVLPFSAVRFQEAQASTEVSVTYGRLTFRVPSQARLDIVTPTARLKGVGQPSLGEVFVSGSGLMGLKMSAGTFNVRPQGSATPPIVAGPEPVFLPQRPASGSFFTTDPIPPPPPQARAVFTPAGENIGYLGPDGRFVIHPGFTQDLTRPLPQKLVRLAAASIPEQQRTQSDAIPLFDVQGRYLGYLAGPVFYAQAPPAAPPSARVAEAAGGVTSAMAVGGAGALAVVGTGVEIFTHRPGHPPCPSPAIPGRPCR